MTAKQCDCGANCKYCKFYWAHRSPGCVPDKNGAPMYLRESRICDDCPHNYAVLPERTAIEVPITCSYVPYIDIKGMCE